MGKSKEAWVPTAGTRNSFPSVGGRGIGRMAKNVFRMGSAQHTTPPLQREPSSVRTKWGRAERRAKGEGSAGMPGVFRDDKFNSGIGGKSGYGKYCGVYILLRHEKGGGMRFQTPYYPKRKKKGPRSKVSEDKNKSPSCETSKGLE